MSEKTMPVHTMYCRRTRRHLASKPIPWAMLSAHDEQAKKNHAGQDLDRLRFRYGISPCEALAILDDRPHTGMDISEAWEELDRRIRAFSEEPKP